MSFQALSLRTLAQALGAPTSGASGPIHAFQVTCQENGTIFVLFIISQTAQNSAQSSYQMHCPPWLSALRA